MPFFLNRRHFLDRVLIELKKNYRKLFYNKKSVLFHLFAIYCIQENIVYNYIIHLGMYSNGYDKKKLYLHIFHNLRYNVFIDDLKVFIHSFYI